MNSHAVVLLAIISVVQALDNGLAKTPPMGWLSWERYACQLDCEQFPNDCVSEQLYMKAADMLVSEGYAAVGYEYVNIDDCWLAKNRTASGDLQADPVRFPHGIKWLADYVHSKGLKLGIYQCIGHLTCAEFPGLNVTTDDTNTQYVKDIALMASWGIDSIKIDGCFAQPDVMNITYPKVGMALNATGRPILYSCSWAFYVMYNKLPVPWDMLVKYCNIWRIWFDIFNTWMSITGTIDFWTRNNTQLSPVPRPGAWHDADQLLIGQTGLTTAQSEAQMAFWCFWGSPLLMSNDLAAVPPEQKAVLQNKELIAISQDEMAVVGQVVNTTKQDYMQLWRRPLANGDVAMLVVNAPVWPLGGPIAMGFTAEQAQLPKNATVFTVRDVLSHKDLGQYNGSFSCHVLTNSVRVFRVTAVE